MNEIITMSDAAVAHIKKIMERNEGAVGFRLSVKETGCSGLMYVPEVIKEAKPEDSLITISGLQIYISKDSIKALEGTKVDLLSKTLGQQQLVFNNPNAESQCGCGESFNLKKTEK